MVYGCARPVAGFTDAASFRRQLRELATLTVYVRTGCPHCADAKKYLSQIRQRYPGIEVRLKDVIADPLASSELQRLSRTFSKGAVSLPVFHACDQLVIGFDKPTTTGAQLEAIL